MSFQNDTYLVSDTPFTNLVTFQVLVFLFKVDLSFLPITNSVTQLHGLFSLLAGLERILRRFSVFAEEPCKSIITAIEPCNPVFKEAQPRPSINHK